MRSSRYQFLRKRRMFEMDNRATYSAGRGILPLCRGILFLCWGILLDVVTHATAH